MAVAREHSSQLCSEPREAAYHWSSAKKQIRRSAEGFVAAAEARRLSLATMEASISRVPTV